MRWRRALAVAVAVGLLSVLGPTQTWAVQPSWGTRLVVDDDGAQCPDAGFTSIQAAVDAAKPFDVVKVCAGRYAEQVTVDEPLKIEGDGAPVMRTHGIDDDAAAIDAADCFSPTRPTFDSNVHVIVAPRFATGDAAVLFDLQADDIELEGFILYGNGDTALNASRAAVETSAAHSGYEIHHNFFVANMVGAFLRSDGEHPSTFHDNCLRESGWGITNQFQSLKDARLYRNNSFLNRNFTYEQTDCASCAFLIGMTDVTFDHNVSRSDFDTFRLARSEGTAVLENDIRGARTGIRTAGHNTGLTIVGNFLNIAAINNRGGPGLAGIAQAGGTTTLGANDGVLIQGNTITGAQNAGIGMGFGALTNSMVLDNVIISSNGLGIVLASGNANNYLSRNIVLDSGSDGIQVAAGATDNKFELNQIHGSGRLVAGVDVRDNNAVLPLNVWIDNDCKTDNQSGAICGTD